MAGNSRTIKAIYEADESGFVKGTNKAGTATSKLSQVLQKLGPVGQGIQGVLDKLGISSLNAGGAMAAGATAGVAAVAAGAAIINKAIDGYVELGAKVREYAVLTGQSAEASSRQVQAFEELGISEETAAGGIVKLSKAIETTPGKLEALGIAIAKDSQGNVDLGQTLLNVAAAWQSTTDAAKRNEIALAAFGRGGAAMTPILEANVAQLARLESQVQTVYTEEDLQKIREYQIANKELDRSWQDLSNTIGRDFLPVKQAVIDDANMNIYVNEHLDEQLKKMGVDTSGSQLRSRVAIIEASKALRDQWQAAQDASGAADRLADAQAAAAKAAQDEADAENRLYDSLQGVNSATDKLADAQLRLTSDQLRLKDAADAYQQAVKEHGKNSRQAQEALVAYQQQLQSLKEQYEAVALATVDAAEKQAEANGTTLSAQQKADIYRGALEKLIKTLAPGDPLRKELQAYIDELNAIPTNVQTNIHTKYSASGVDSATGNKTRSGGTQQFAGGGMVEGSAQEHPVLAKRGEMVLTEEQQAAIVPFIQDSAPPAPAASAPVSAPSSPPAPPQPLQEAPAPAAPQTAPEAAAPAVGAAAPASVPQPEPAEPVVLQQPGALSVAEPPTAAPERPAAQQLSEREPELAAPPPALVHPQLSASDVELAAPAPPPVQVQLSASDAELAAPAPSLAPREVPQAPALEPPSARPAQQPEQDQEPAQPPAPEPPAQPPAIQVVHVPQPDQEPATPDAVAPPELPAVRVLHDQRPAEPPAAPAATAQPVSHATVVEMPRPIEVKVYVNGVIIGTAQELSKILARELRLSGAFKNL